MVKVHSTIGLLVLVAAAKAQSQDTVYQKQELSTTDIQALFSYYNQEGNGSAVTGGVGTEHLNVYAPSVTIKHTFGTNSIAVNGGVDVISSASTDNIDFEVSSASVLDARIFLNASYRKQLDSIDLGITGGTGFSIESDYLSIPLLVGVDYTEPSKARTYAVTVQAFFDDLRWGRLSPSNRRPVKLIYPAELRYREWYDVHTRNSYNLKTAFTQVINNRLILALFPEVTYQSGLLATPFHRVYFNDGSLRVENLPGQRTKVDLGVQLNAFLGGAVILRGQYGFYRDNFGIVANSIQMEGAVKITPTFTVTPFARLYAQSASDYFRAYGEHDTTETYYTSDNDLSRFSSYKAGINIRFAPFSFISDMLQIKEIDLRYAFYHRTNDLDAHILSLAFDLGLGI